MNAALCVEGEHRNIKPTVRMEPPGYRMFLCLLWCSWKNINNKCLLMIHRLPTAQAFSFSKQPEPLYLNAFETNSLWRKILNLYNLGMDLWSDVNGAGVLGTHFSTLTLIFARRASMEVASSWTCLAISCLPSFSPLTTWLNLSIRVFRLCTFTIPSMLWKGQTYSNSTYERVHTGLYAAVI